MRVGIMQPYFLPHIGYWQLIGAVERYVVYDDVTYIKGGWINRNNFLLQGEKKMLTLEVGGAGSFTPINEVRMIDSLKKFSRAIEMNYHKAPFYDEAMSVLGEILAFGGRALSDFLYNSISVLCRALGLGAELLLSSRLEKDDGLKGKDQVLAICECLGADEYLNAIGGTGLYDKTEFAARGIRLSFLRPRPIEYSQFGGEFVPGLSILDVLMFNGVAGTARLLREYDLV